jgi:O-antigen ligase
MGRASHYLLLGFAFTLPWQDAELLAGANAIGTPLIALSLLAAGIAAISRGRVAKPTPLLVAMLVFAGWHAASLLWTIDSDTTVTRSLTMLQLTIMVWLVTEVTHSEKRLNALMQAYVLGCVVAAGTLYHSYLSGQAVEGFRYAPEGSSLNMTGQVLALGVAVALLLLSRERRGALLWLNVAFIPAALVAVILTASRSGFLITLLSLGGLLFVLNRLRFLHRVGWVALIFAISFGVFFGLTKNERLEQNLERVTFAAELDSARTLTGRTVIWSAGWHVFQRSPVLGVGAGGFSKAVMERLGTARGPHNLFLAVVVETGFVGLGLLITVLAAALFAVTGARGAPRALFLMLFLVTLVVASVANTQTSKVFWFTLAVLSMAALRADPQSAPSLSPRSLTVAGSYSRQGARTA